MAEQQLVQQLLRGYFIQRGPAIDSRGGAPELGGLLIEFPGELGEGLRLEIADKIPVTQHQQNFLLGLVEQVAAEVVLGNVLLDEVVGVCLDVDLQGAPELDVLIVDFGPHHFFSGNGGEHKLLHCIDKQKVFLGELAFQESHEGFSTEGVVAEQIKNLHLLMIR